MHKMEAIISSKGQIVIPKVLRERYKLERGNIIVFEDTEGYIKLIPRTRMTNINVSIDLERAGREIETMRKEWR